MAKSGTIWLLVITVCSSRQSRDSGRPNVGVEFSVESREGSYADPEDGQVVGQVVGKRDPGTKDEAGPEGRAGDRGGFLAGCGIESSSIHKVGVQWFTCC